MLSLLILTATAIQSPETCGMDEVPAVTSPDGALKFELPTGVNGPVGVVSDTRTGASWAVALPDLPDCMPVSQLEITWKTGRLLVEAAAGRADQIALIDLAKHAVVGSGHGLAYAAPRLAHVAVEIADEDEVSLEIDGTPVFTGIADSSVRWASSSKLEFCGQTDHDDIGHTYTATRKKGSWRVVRHATECSPDDEG